MCSCLPRVAFPPLAVFVFASRCVSVCEAVYLNVCYVRGFFVVDFSSSSQCSCMTCMLLNCALEPPSGVCVCVCVCSVRSVLVRRIDPCLSATCVRCLPLVRVSLCVVYVHVRVYMFESTFVMRYLRLFCLSARLACMHTYKLDNQRLASFVRSPLCAIVCVLVHLYVHVCVLYACLNTLDPCLPFSH